MHLPVQANVVAGELNPLNSAYVMTMLIQAVTACLAGKFSALVTAPVHKGIINQAGIAFSGHTEFLADQCGVQRVVMILAAKTLRVALMTTHIPLHAVPKTITKQLIHEVITIIEQGLRMDFGITKPIIRVAGLNPHAGESGYLGREEIEIIAPALDELRNQGLTIEGPLSADTMFVNQDNSTAVYVAMYHDQGLPVIKYAGFSDAVNITLGLPIIRTSVDHGTALAIAGKGSANPGSLVAAITLASELIINRERYNDQSESYCRD